MKSIFNKMFRKRTVTFGHEIRNFVNVLDSSKRKQKSDDVCCGIIESVDFDKRTLTITTDTIVNRDNISHTIPFDEIVTISRMKDGRLRMWINREGD